MDNETREKVRTRARKIFNEGAIQTIGDLAKERKLSGWEKLPERVRAYSLDPDKAFSIPSNYFVLMSDAGFDPSAALVLADAASAFKINYRNQANTEITQPQPTPPSL